jgi:hypothetical protein
MANKVYNMQTHLVAKLAKECFMLPTMSFVIVNFQAKLIFKNFATLRPMLFKFSVVQFLFLAY